MWIPEVPQSCLNRATGARCQNNINDKPSNLELIFTIIRYCLRRSREVYVIERMVLAFLSKFLPWTLSSLLSVPSQWSWPIPILYAVLLQDIVWHVSSQIPFAALSHFSLHTMFGHPFRKVRELSWTLRSIVSLSFIVAYLSGNPLLYRKNDII